MKKINVRGLAVSAIMGSLSFVLMLLAFSLPFLPSFLEFDISDLPALITSFAFGPLYGILVCFIKNLLHLLVTRSLMVGELSNFILGSVFVGIAGLIYKKGKSKVSAFWGSFLGAAVMALFGVLSNYYVVYPVYAAVFMPYDAILGLYRAILPSVKNLWQALLIFNLPFTFIKGLFDVAICMAIYKKLSPILKNGKSDRR